MKKALSGIGLSLLIIIVIVFIRATTFTSKPLQPEPAAQIILNKQHVARNLSEAIRFRTVSLQDIPQANNEQFKAFQRFLKHTFPKVHAALKQEAVTGNSLLYTWSGSNHQLKPVIMLAHQDVVPIDESTKDQWTHPPFSGTVADGYIWGRGTLDDKCGLMGILEAIELLITKGYQPKRTLYLTLVHDEETGGYQGAAEIAALLKKRGIKPDYILDEGAVITDGIVPGVSAPAALIGIAEKGYLSVELIAKVDGGHSSMPPRQTAVGILSSAIARLENQQMPAVFSKPLQQMFEALGPEMPFVKKMIFANLWLFKGLVQRQLATKPATNAVLRTTTAPTMIEGSVKENVLPVQAKAVINFRILPGNTIKQVLAHIENVVNDQRIEIKPLMKRASNPPPAADLTNTGYQLLKKTIHQVFPETVIAPSIVLARTASLHFAGMTSNIYHFRPWRVTRKDLKRIHGINERISVEDYTRLIKFYVQLIRNI